MPDDKEKDLLIDDSLDTESEHTLFHSCSKPDIVEIEGKEIKCDRVQPIKEDNNNPWLKVSGFLRSAEERILKIVKRNSDE